MSKPFGPVGLDVRVWNGVEIQRRPSDGYVNATAMCKANGKRWNHYASNDRTQAYIAARAAVAGIPATGNDGLVQTIQGGPPHLQGTWVHPGIAVDLARWISPAFAVWMDDWFLEAAAGQVSQVRDTQPAAQPIARPEPTTVLTAPAHWCHLVDDYVDDVETGLADVPFAARRRSLRFARPLATHFMQWLIDHHARLELPCSGSPTSEVVPLTNTLPQAGQQGDPDAAPTWDGINPTSAVLPRQRLLGQHFESGYRMATPELAKLLGITCSALNAWCRRYGTGAERNGWRLIGQGKIAAGKLGAHIPPGRPSWIFERI